jgi:F0F1-type ATP synthase assembly protein I
MDSSQKPSDHASSPGVKRATGRGGPVHQESAAETRLGWKMAGMGFQVASEVAAGVLLGWLFDRWRGVPGSNFGVIVGASVGILVGIGSLIRTAVKLNRELDAVSPKRERIEYKPGPDEQDSDWEDNTAEDDDWKHTR